MPNLTKKEQQVRATLIKVCQNKLHIPLYRKINYKRIWQRHGKGVWGQAHTKDVVTWIVNISDHDMAKGLPPLNALVVRIDTKMPGAQWDDWNKKYGKRAYKSVAQAQEACWEHWKVVKRK